MASPATLAVGDAHFPWASKGTLRKVVALARQLQPARIVQMGDLYDLYSWSRFARSINFITPHQEMVKAREVAEKFWRDLRAAAPKAKCYQLMGNHDERPFKRVAALAPEFESIVSNGLKGFWEFDGVHTVGSERDELILDGVCYMHGYRQHGQHVTYNLMNTVVGHLHTGGTVFHRQQGKTLWELNAGFIADRTTLPLSYSQQRRFSRLTEGVGWVDAMGPRFIPL